MTSDDINERKRLIEERETDLQVELTDLILDITSHLRQTYPEFRLTPMVDGQEGLKSSPHACLVNQKAGNVWLEVIDTNRGVCQTQKRYGGQIIGVQDLDVNALKELLSALEKRLEEKEREEDGMTSNKLHNEIKSFNNRELKIHADLVEKINVVAEKIKRRYPQHRSDEDKYRNDDLRSNGTACLLDRWAPTFRIDAIDPATHQIQYKKDGMEEKIDDLRCFRNDDLMDILRSFRDLLSCREEE